MDALGADDPGYPLVEDTATITTAAKRLTERERRVLDLRFHHDLTQTEIAQQIGVSQMQVSRILRHTLNRLRELTDDHPLASSSARHPE